MYGIKGNTTSLFLYSGTKAPHPWKLFSGWFFYSSSPKTFLKENLFYPLPSNYQSNPWPTQDEIFARIARSLNLEEALEDPSKFTTLSEAQKNLSLKDFIEALMLSLCEIFEDEYMIQAPDLPIALETEEENIVKPSHLLEAPQKSKSTRKRPSVITPWGQPEHSFSQNLSITRQGVRAHVEQFFETHPDLKDLKIKSVNVKGSHVVLHSLDKAPTTHVRPHKK